MSMADDRTFKSYRTPEPRARAAEPPRSSAPTGAGDPLAELARLIGQNDPFAEFGRNSQRHAPRADQAPRAEQAPQPNYAPQREDYPPQRDYPQHDPYAAPQSAPADWQHPSASEPRYASEGSRYRDDAYAQDPRDQDVPARDPHRHDPRYADEPEDVRAPADHRGQHYADDRLHSASEDARERADAGVQYDDARHDDAHRDDAQQDEDHEYRGDDAPLEPHEDDMYDDAPRARRHGGLATALALIGCAMLGTAGAYAYRSYTGQPSATQPPPVITADSATPTKIVPVPAVDPQAGKGMDRMANASKEQIISKQEEPVALKEVGTQAAPRVVLPAPVAPVQPGAVPPAGLTEPKRVKPIAIGPDGNELSGRPVGGPPAPAPASAASRTAPAPKAAAPAPSASGPLSLQPQADEPAAAPAPRTRQAVVAPPPTRPAAEPSTGSTGGFVVQLSSQKSESEAQSAFRSLQAKFPNELGSRQPIIRRADLGAKGIFYRTMVGPFASAQEASQFCSGYKSAGGQCMVPSN
jgi:hypothetical protein